MCKVQHSQRHFVIICRKQVNGIEKKDRTISFDHTATELSLNTWISILASKASNVKSGLLYSVILFAIDSTCSNVLIILIKHNHGIQVKAAVAPVSSLNLKLLASVELPEPALVAEIKNYL